MKSTILLALAFLAANGAVAETLKVDATSSQAQWTGFKAMGSSHTGAVSLKEGTVMINEKGELTGGEFVIDMKSITNDDLKDNADYHKKLLGHLSSADFFNVEKFPTATYKVKSAKKKGDGYDIKGDLTMIGVTKPLDFTAKVATNKTEATGEGELEVDRTKWGLKYNSGNFFKDLAADKIIKDKFSMKLKIVAKK